MYIKRFFKVLLTCCWLALLVTMLLAGCSGGSGSESQAQQQSVMVTGTVTYEDWEYDANGFTGVTASKAVRFAEVDLVDASANVVDTTTTDAMGAYQLSGSGSGLYVRVLAQTGQSFGVTISINNFNADVYAATQTIDTASQGSSATVDLNITDSSGVGGPFNMLDLFTSAVQFVNSLSDISLPELSVYWQKGNNYYGTYYCFGSLVALECPQGGGIYVTGGIGNSGDTDQYDDDVLWHEFGHYVEDTVGILDSPGGAHQLTNNTLDLRLAWSEGWANYFSGAVKAWLSTNEPALLSTATGTEVSRYIDTVGNVTNSDVGISIDLANPGLCGSTDCFVYSSNEVAVAKVLHQLREMYGAQALWDVYQNYLNNSNGFPADMEKFWDGLLTQTAPDAGQVAILDSIYNDRQIYYQKDSYEAMVDVNLGDATLDSQRLLTVCTAVQCDSEEHYLYYINGSEDADVVAFAAELGKSYTIETFDLKNGADTYLYLLNGDNSAVLDPTNGNPIENDDRNDDCSFCINDSLSFSSMLTFSPQTSDTYYIKIVTSPVAAAGAGRYGTYSLKITEQ